MALLREQRRLVKATVERPFGDEIKEATELQLIVHFQKNPLFNGEKGKDFLHPRTVIENNKREHRIITLLRACIKDDFIESVTEQYLAPDYGRMQSAQILAMSFEEMGKVPMVNKTQDYGYHATSRGTDLLTFLGFWTIFLKKHQIIVGIILGVLGTVVVGALKWALEHSDQIGVAIEMVKSLYVR